MTTVTALEAKTRFGKLLDRVARGEEIVITRHEKPVARIISEGAEDLTEVRKAAAGLRELSRQIAAHPIKGAKRSRLTFAEVKSAVAEGRR